MEVQYDDLLEDLPNPALMAQEEQQVVPDQGAYPDFNLGQIGFQNVDMPGSMAYGSVLKIKLCGIKKVYDVKHFCDRFSMNPRTSTHRQKLSKTSSSPLTT